MRLLIALPDRQQALLIARALDAEWEIALAHSGPDAIHLLGQMDFDLLVIHFCLPLLEGQAVGQRLSALAPLCPPRVIYLCPPECCRIRPGWADAVVTSGVSDDGLIRLLRTIAQKPLPKLAAAHAGHISAAVNRFLDEIALSKRYKGRQYAAWLLAQMIPSPCAAEQPLGQWYTACARAFGTTAASVERCLRVAVEHVFTSGSMQGIERYFGATVDPEKGKPTNRAFLLQACTQLREQLRYSLTEARSPNSSVMHHSPAAPTRV